MTALPKRRLTEEEYLATERTAAFKSEFYDGEMFAMAGAGNAHNLIAGNIFGELRQRFKGRPCLTYMSEMRVCVADTGLYTYPDVIALCGQPRFTSERDDTLLNPQVIIEVLSPSTEAYDRGEKFSRYSRIASLTDYVLVAQDKMLVEHYARQMPGDRWLLTRLRELQESLRLASSIDAELTLAEIYERVEFPPPPAEPPSR